MFHSESIREVRVNTALAMLITLVPNPTKEQISSVSAVFCYGLKQSGISEDLKAVSLSDCFRDVRLYLLTRCLNSEPCALIRSSLLDTVRQSDIRYIPENTNSLYSLFSDWISGDGIRYSHPVSDFCNLFWDIFWLFCASRKTLFNTLYSFRIAQPDPDPAEESLHIFLYRLSYLTDRDGVLSELYSALRSDIHLIGIGYDALRNLAELQEQYNHLFDYHTGGALPSGYDAHYALERINLFDFSVQTPLIRFYILYLRAEACRFVGAYDNAVILYREFLDEISPYKTDDVFRNRMDIRWIQICLHHAIGRCLQKTTAADGFALARKEFELMLPMIREQDRSRPFLNICLKNYATCLENLSEYGKAIRQYEKVIEMQTVAHRNYKLYDTYCSAVMKNWDKMYGKLSENWLINTQTLSLPADCYPISEVLMDKMEMYLKVAERLQTELPNINIQRAKLYVYRMLAGLDEPGACLEKARREIAIADCLSVEKSGVYYIKRDLNYAEYLITGDITRLHRASDINIRLNGQGDSTAFAELLTRIR